MDNIKKILEIRSVDDLISAIGNLTPKTFNFLASNERLAKLVIKVLDRSIKKAMLTDDRYSPRIREDRYFMYRSLLNSFQQFIARPKSKHYLGSLASVVSKMTELGNQQKTLKRQFMNEHGVMPPSFLAISPGKFCNLNCVGCYANSNSDSREKLSFDVFDKIISEKSSWGSWFTVISGGEPFLWHDSGRDLFDLVAKHQDNFFLVYTNGTLVDEKLIEKLSKVGNITLAISVEGFEAETDWRRGKGVWKKIIKAMALLKNEGIPFGISTTATNKNHEILASEEFYDFYWRQGALYAWMFQLMPIGRGSFEHLISAEERLNLYRKIQDIIKKGYFVADFWNCGAVSNGCISAGREGGYFYIEWNGNITPCTFNPYAVGNVNKIYAAGGSIAEVMHRPFMRHIREWQREYGFGSKDNIQNWIMPCPIRDHYKTLRKYIDQDKPVPLDEAAKMALSDNSYRESMIKYDQSLQKALNPIWEVEYGYSPKTEDDDEPKS
jgi:MoaA/NifB/PqqE/SkfB family radical SAM enzyme